MQIRQKQKLMQALEKRRNTPIFILLSLIPFPKQILDSEYSRQNLISAILYSFTSFLVTWSYDKQEEIPWKHPYNFFFVQFVQLLFRRVGLGKQGVEGGADLLRGEHRWALLLRR